MWVLEQSDGKDVPASIVGQVLGAALGAFIIWAILETSDNTFPKTLTREALFGVASNGFANHSPSGFAFWAVVITEVVFTALFILVMAGTGVGSRGRKGRTAKDHDRRGGGRRRGIRSIRPRPTERSSPASSQPVLKSTCDAERHGR